MNFKLEVIIIPVSDVDRAKGSTKNLAGGSTPTLPRATSASCN